MRVRTPLIVSIGLLAATACAKGTVVPAQAPPMTEETAPVALDASSAPDFAAPNLDPVEVAMTPEGVVALCDARLTKAGAIRDGIKGLAGKSNEALTYGTTLGQVDDLTFEISLAAGFSELMAQGHPDEKVREAALGCRPKVESFHTDLMLDAAFAGVIRQYASKGDKLEGTRKRLLDDLLREFRRNGLELAAEQQGQLRELNEELTQLEQQFAVNLSDAVGELKVKPNQLKGLSDDFKKGHLPGEDGLVTLTTNYPDYFPIVTDAEDRTVARDLTRLFHNRAADKNLTILDEVLTLREKKAKLLGYETWADYAIEPRMAKTKEAVSAFLADAANTVKGPAQGELKEFRAKYVELGGDAKKPIPNYDRMYLEQKLRQEKYNFDAQELSKYFEVTSVTDGLLGIVSRIYGVDVKENGELPRWHEDVRVFELSDKGKSLGRIYLDLYPRDGKYKHAAMFDIRVGKRQADGTYVRPMAALLCNFPKTTAEVPGLLTHDQVTTFFHEFGHALHHVLTQEELASYAGTNTVRDFVEAPSQMFEEWAFRRETLDLFAKHHESGEKIPKELFEALSRSRAFGRALSTERQISLASLDFEYHSRKRPFDTDKVMLEVMQKTQSFGTLPDTHFQGTFGHLMGYDAGYYGYQWALAIARDVLTRFDKEGYLDEAVAKSWRESVLEKGGGADEVELVTEFLGRKPDLKAYGRFLSGK